MMENSRQAGESCGEAEQAGSQAVAIAALRHQFRNEIQTITSLVGLFGDRMEAGPARAAFVDLRARLEATAVMHADEFTSGDKVRCDAMLAALARRIAALYESGRHLTLDIDTISFAADPRRAATIAQLFAEMLIEFFRSGTSASQSGVASAVIGGDGDGALSLRISGRFPAPAARGDEVSALGRMILQSLAQSLGGEVSRDLSNGFGIGMDAPGGAVVDEEAKVDLGDRTLAD